MRPSRTGQRLVWLAVAVCLVAAGCGAQDSRTRAALEAGDVAARQRAFREALDQYRLAAAAAPASFTAQTRRGAIAEVLGEFEEALEAYGRAARVTPSALAYYRAGAMAERIGNTALAVEYLEASLTAPPSRREQAAGIALRWLRSLSAGLAGSRLARMLPEWVYQGLGAGQVVLSGATLDRDAVAGSAFAALLEGGDTGRALDFARARGWVREGADYCADDPGPVAAETWALVGMLVEPQRADCLLDVGRALTDGGLVRLSRLVLQDRIRNSPDRRVRAQAGAFLRHRLPAHDVPKLAESLNVVGYNLQHRYQDPGAAAAVYRRAITADPRFSWPYANLGRLYLDLDQHEVALDWLRTAVRVNPDHFRAQVNLGVTLHVLARYDEAATAYRAALALQADDAGVHADLGRSLLKLGQEGEGLRELQIAVRLDPSLTEEREFLNRKLGRDPRSGPTPFSTR